MVGWHHGLDGHEFEQVPGNSEGQGSLVGYSPWGHKEVDTTDQLNKMTKCSIACMCALSCVRRFVTPRTYQAPWDCPGKRAGAGCACMPGSLDGWVAPTLGRREQRCREHACALTRSHSVASPVVVVFTSMRSPASLHSCWHFMKVPVSPHPC